MKTTPLPQFRIPDYPNSPISINGAPLSIIDHPSLPSEPQKPQDPQEPITPPLAICSILHNWSHHALTAFLDLDAWFSFTWIRKDRERGETIEIGRVGNQITFGTLDGSGEEWKVMITFNVGLGDGSDGEDEGEGEDEGGKDEHGGKRESRRGGWIVNRKECMQGERDVTDIQEIEILAQEMGKTWVEDKVWQTGKGVKHEFYVEYAPMDIWGDGIAMNPGWLYESLDLGKCSGCDASASASLSAHDSRETQLKDSSPTQLSRCGKCGTATYCSSACQKKDWPVHKHICSLGLEERGQMLAITQKGGLIAWDKERMYAREGSGEMSKNPFLEEGTVKRWRSEEWFVNDEEEEMKKMETRD